MEASSLKTISFLHAQNLKFTYAFFLILTDRDKATI